ncbi:hypothetical protein CSKR_109170 [Clonorchis sinensis]|uniref:Uncharacterized protein n=1 Tax=Clonorchis sinensis TaxID=79923 RepID=A0A3R7DGW9_CLOSI|nr:hypothetical protein CSKR_109170 [Clonorchis sinensis]
MEGITSVFNNDASLLYNQDLFESLITLIQTIWIETDNVTDNGWQPYLEAPPTRLFVITFIILCKVKGWPPLCFRQSELGTENSTLFGKRWLGMRNTCPNQRSFWCWTHSSMEVTVAQPKARFLIASLRILRHEPTRTVVEHASAPLAKSHSHITKHPTV